MTQGRAIKSGIIAGLVLSCKGMDHHTHSLYRVMSDENGFGMVLRVNFKDF
jgi:hypothetical protein